MKALNFWKTLFCAALLTTAFTACSNDDEGDGVYSGIPEITVNGSDKAVAVGALTGGNTAAVEVVTKGNWTLKFNTPADASWCTPSKLSGKTGTTQLTFKLGATPSARETVVTLTASGQVAGQPIDKNATITVKQNASGEFNLIFKETVGMGDVSANPVVDAYKGWVTTGSGASGVTYAGSTKTSVRKSGLANTGAYEGASGPNVVFFGTAPTTFTVQNIALTAEQTNLQLTFGGSFSYKPEGGDYINTFDPANFKVSLSNDGVDFVPITYTINDGDQKTPYWVLATADFTLTKAVSKLYIQFEALTSSAYRLDDITLQTGDGGQQVDLEAGPVFVKTTLDKLGAGKYEITDATIVGVHQKGVMFAQNISGKFYYAMNFNNDWATQTANPYISGINKLITFTGDCAIRYGLYQFSGVTADAGAASSLQLPAPKVLDAAAIKTIVDAAVANKDDKTAWSAYEYVKLTGVLKTSEGTATGGVKYTSYEITDVVGNTTPISLAYGLDSYFTGLTNGDAVDVTGFMLGYDTQNSKMNIMATNVVKNTVTTSITITSTPKTFVAAGEAQDISFNAVNIPAGSSVFAKVEGGDASQFTVGAVANNKVTVTAQNNATPNAKTTTLKVYIATAADAVATYSDEVVLMQAGVSSGNTTTVTVDFRVAGTYPQGFPDKTGTKGDKVAAKFGGYDFIINAPDAYYAYTAQKAMFLGKSTTDIATTAYIQFPVVAGKKLTKVEFTTGQQGGKDIILDIYNQSGTAVSDGSYKTLSGLGTTEYSHTFVITGSNDTAYRLASISPAGKNIQVAELVLTYE